MFRTRGPVLVLVLFLSACLQPNVASASEWKQIGPYGGDVRSLAAVPGDFSRLFLGTSNGQVYASTDGGRSWTWWSELDVRSDYVVDDLIVDSGDPRVLYAGAWSTEVNGGGGVFKSTDGGRTWRPLPSLAGKPVRSLVQWRKDPRVLVAGAMDGVYRSRDAGNNWERISPAGHEEIRNIESLAIDPQNADIIYAGTWHLPWKTADGGLTWTSIREGMIDDSDVFSIQVDWNNPERAYASACSGIYRSDSAGRLWRKIQGIPHSARRTRVIRQDPKNPAVVYAGTTEGLWKTESGGDNWRRVTSARLIVNDIVIDPADPSHVVLGTDRAGVLQSSDAGENFQATNQGFAHRQVSAAALDPATGRLYAAVLNDKEYGGIFTSTGGRGWEQVSQGLEGDVFALICVRGSPGGKLLAGLRDGLMVLDPKANAWSRIGRVAGGAARPFPAPVSHARPQRSGSRRRAPPAPASHPGTASGFSFGVNEFFQAGPDQPVYAATSSGLFRSDDLGATWRSISIRLPATAVSGDSQLLVAGSAGGVQVSLNGGQYWFPLYLPTGSDMPHVNSVALSGRTIFAATDLGLFRSADGGVRWEKKGSGVPYGPVSSVLIDPRNSNVVYAASRLTGNVYVSQDGGLSFQAMERRGLVGWRFRSLELVPRPGSSDYHLLLISGFDGLFLRPVASAAAAQAAGRPAGTE